MKKKKTFLTFSVVVISTIVIHVFLYVNFSAPSLNPARQNFNKNTCFPFLSTSSDHLTLDEVNFSVSSVNRGRSHLKNQSFWSYQIFDLKITSKETFIVDLPDWISHTSTLPIYLFTHHLII